MNNHRPFPFTRIVFFLSLAAVFFVLSRPALATGNIVKSDLAGNWQIALRGNTGCGFSAMLASINMNTSGTGTGTLQTHGQCGNSTLSNQTFKITSLSSDGAGKAGLTCGSGCGWTFDIQVSPDRTKFNLVDVTPANPNNFVEGEGVLKSTAGNVVVADLKGNWTVTLYSFTGCGDTSTEATFTLDATGHSTNAKEIMHSAGCGDSVTTGNTFTVSSLNSDGSGIAGLSCGSGCGWTFNIQVSPDRSTMNLVDVATINPNNFLGGTGIRASSAGDIVKANLAGSWQLALDGFGGCGNGSDLVKFNLNSSGVATNVHETTHSGCGDGTTTTNKFTIISLNPDGSGTAGLTCGSGCGFTFNIQVAPDRSTFNVVQVATFNPSNFQAGVAIHQ